jgi:P-type Ca2+ transporter type 2A
VQVLAHFQADPIQGLAPAQVAEARRLHGYNELPPDKATPLTTLMLKQFDDLLVKILLAAAVADLLTTIAQGGAGVTAFVEPFIILLILVANAAVGVATETNAEAAISSLKALEAEVALCVRSGALTTVAMRDIVPGDILEVSVGQKIPADCYVLDVLGGSLQVDQSILTGESGCVDKVAGAIEAPAGAVAQDKHNLLFSGSLVTSGRCSPCACVHLLCMLGVFRTEPSHQLGRSCGVMRTIVHRRVILYHP